jgi:hypothetical protein
MVLFALREYPQPQEQIIRTIAEIWDTIIDRKAVGRHLQLLQNLGFPVRHGSDGYYYNGKPGTPKTNMKYSPSAYPLLILQELESERVREKYNSYMVFSLYSDIENCARNLLDFETAYRYASKKLSLLEAFKS